MPIYFSSEDGKYYSKDIHVAGITDGFFSTKKRTNIVNYIDDIKKITHQNNYSQISKEDKIILFKNDIENYLNKTYKYLNFNGIDEINSIVNSGLTTINGLTNDRYYEALTLSKWKNKVDVFVGDIIDKFASGTTTLSEPKEFLKNNPSFPKIPVVDQLSLDYSRNNLFNNRNYTVFNDGNNSNPRQTSPLIIEEIVRGLTTSLTGIGPIDGQCITNGDPEIIQNEEINTTVYKFPVTHIVGFQPSDEIINFISNPTPDNMIEAFFGGGTNGLIPSDSGLTFPRTGTLGLPIPIISLTGGVVGANGETGNPFASIYVEGLTQGYDIFNMLPDSFDETLIPDFFEEILRPDVLDGWNKGFRIIINNFCRKFLDQGDGNYEVPNLIPGLTSIYDGGFTGATSFSDMPGIDPNFGRILDYIPIISDKITDLQTEGDVDKLLEYLNNMKIITTKHMNAACAQIPCENVNWYDPNTNPCGVVFWKQCCERYIEVKVDTDLDLRYWGISAEHIILPILRSLESCGIVDFKIDSSSVSASGIAGNTHIENMGTEDPLKFLEDLLKGMPFTPISQPLIKSCNECTPPPDDPYDVSSSCFQGSSCGLPVYTEGTLFEDVVFEHPFMFHINGACLAKLLKGIICGRDFGIDKIIERLFGPGIIPPSPSNDPISDEEFDNSEEYRDGRRVLDVIDDILGTLNINIKIRFFGRNVVYYSTAAGCGCDSCPCESAPCVSDENCVETKIPTLYLPNTSV